MTNRFTFDDALQEELEQVQVPILGEVAALEPAEEEPQEWGPEQLKAAIDAIKAEKRRMTEAAAAVNQEMHRDSFLCRRLGKKPNRELPKKFMEYNDRVGALDMELRTIDPSLPSPNWNKSTDQLCATNIQGFPGHP